MKCESIIKNAAIVLAEISGLEQRINDFQHNVKTKHMSLIILSQERPNLSKHRIVMGQEIFGPEYLPYRQ
ncbi:MAG: hypothetical protein ACW99G_12835 [Candidatus Thorarchaeota archaeon]